MINQEYLESCLDINYNIFYTTCFNHTMIFLYAMIKTCHLKNVIFIQTILSFVLSRKICISLTASLQIKQFCLHDLYGY